ncbi:beta-glucuronidase, partial [Faecalibacterium prausnitzii]|uniref:glycoside hydrolase family 2 TIM barrel-domain containing protein n=1 Tax=Faecalibacterium prausnitzii TaxID=853 RepID=UPI002731E341
WAEQHKPVMMCEYGADTVAGLHTAGAEMVSEEFQVEFYSRLDAEFDQRPWVVGEFVWTFADSDTVQGPMPVDGH